MAHFKVRTTLLAMVHSHVLKREWKQILTVVALMFCLTVFALEAETDQGSVDKSSLHPAELPANEVDLPPTLNVLSRRARQVYRPRPAVVGFTVGRLTSPYRYNYYHGGYGGYPYYSNNYYYYGK